MPSVEISIAEFFKAHDLNGLWDETRCDIDSTLAGRWGGKLARKVPACEERRPAVPDGA